jgi:hypothetical protein
MDGGAMTFVFFSLSGDRATMQDGFRTMSETLDRVAPQTRVQPPRISGPAVGQSLLPFADGALGAELPDTTGDERNGHDENALDGGSALPPPAGSSSSRGLKKAFKSPVVLDDLRFDVSPTLREVFGPNPVEEITKRYLVIADYVKKYKKIDEVTMDHIHTGFRAMGWNTPEDAGSPLRGMLRKQWFSKGSKRGFFKINHIGEGEVMKILGEKR